jgi:DHA2 family multidrug resistance protein
MDSIKPERMGNATSLFNLMRNIGGSIGIAMTGTMLARRSQAYTSVIGAHVTGYTSQTQSMMAQMQAAFVAAGADVVTAAHRAEAAMFGMVQRQATMVAFVSIFQLLAVVFLGMVLLVLLMKRPKGRGGRGAAAAAH